MSLMDFILSIVSSLIASIIFGLFTNTLLGKSTTDTIVKIYAIYVSGAIFVTGVLFAYLTNTQLIELVSRTTDLAVLTIYNYSVIIFIGLFVLFALITLIFLFVRQIELNNKSRDKKYDQYMKNIYQTKQRGEKK